MCLMIFDSQFWISFWPNFFSTLIGVLLGIPLALWTNRIILRHEEENQIAKEKSLLQKLMRVIVDSMYANKQKLMDTKSILEGNKAVYETGLDTTTWDAVSADINKLFHTPNLQKRIAYL